MIQQIKIYFIAVAAAGASVWGVAEYYLEDYVIDTATEVIEEKTDKKSFREILGEEMRVPTDAVPYYLVKKLDLIDSLVNEVKVFETEYMPYLEFQLSIQPTYFFFDEGGTEWWMGPDGYPHGVMYDEKGKWCVYHGQRKDL